MAGVLGSYATCGVACGLDYEGGKVMEIPVRFESRQLRDGRYVVQTRRGDDYDRYMVCAQGQKARAFMVYKGGVQ